MPKTPSSRSHHFHYSDLLKLTIFVVVCFVLFQFFDGSQLYHDIRGQSLMKLYVIYNMLEVIDRLCYSFGVDILESLFLRATRNERGAAKDEDQKHSLPFVAHFLLALIYVGWFPPARPLLTVFGPELNSPPC